MFAFLGEVLLLHPKCGEPLLHPSFCLVSVQLDGLQRNLASGLSLGVGDELALLVNAPSSSCSI